MFKDKFIDILAGLFILIVIVFVVIGYFVTYNDKPTEPCPTGYAWEYDSDDLEWECERD